MKKIFLIVIMGFSFFGLFGQSAQFKTVGAKEFAAYIENPEVTVLDVRTAEEYAEGHIPGTDFNIDVLKKGFAETASEKLPEGRPVALYCRSGNRSKTAARILSQMGYEVVELGTGYRGWAAQTNKSE